jgi:hypothetical protein
MYQVASNQIWQQQALAPMHDMAQKKKYLEGNWLTVPMQKNISK